MRHFSAAVVKELQLQPSNRCSAGNACSQESCQTLGFWRFPVGSGHLPPSCQAAELCPSGSQAGPPVCCEPQSGCLPSPGQILAPSGALLAHLHTHTLLESHVCLSHEDLTLCRCLWSLFCASASDWRSQLAMWICSHAGSSGEDEINAVVYVKVFCEASIAPARSARRVHKVCMLSNH